MGKKQNAKNTLFIKPSPNEEVKLLQTEKDKLRKIRLQQVREQEKLHANQLRKKFKQKEKTELQLLGNELKKAWGDNIAEKKATLEKLYFENVSHVGEGHQEALMRPDTGEPKMVSSEEQAKVTERYKQAMKKLKADEIMKSRAEQERSEFKQKSLETERLRAARIASLEPPAPDIAQSLDIFQKHKCKTKSIDQYSSTYYHLPRDLVEKADPDDSEQPDARDAAIDEENRIQNAKLEADRNFSEQMEKARLRHKHARSKMLLQKDHDKLLEELHHFERIDRQRRQNIVSKIPKHIFEPPHRRLEANEERQRDIEHAFEDIYMAHTNYMGDVNEVRGPLATSPAASDATPAQQDQPGGILSEMREVDHGSEEDVPIVVTDDGVGPDGVGPQELAAGKKKIVDEAEKSRAQPSAKDPLKRLMKKIDVQRDRWRTVNKMKVFKEDVNRHDAGSASSERTSEFSEGLLSTTIDSAQKSDGEPFERMETLLHPYEEAERIRTGVMGEVKDRESEVGMSEIEKQKQLLQQQKLKLQLEQQKILQEHLELQFDMLQRDSEAKPTEDGLTEIFHPSGVGDESATKPEGEHEYGDGGVGEMFSSVSTGLLSEEEKTTARESPHDNEEDLPGRPPEEDITPPLQASHTVLSGLSAISENVFEESFVQLTPMQPNEPILNVLPQPRPFHIQIPATTTDQTEHTRSPYDIPRSHEASRSPMPQPRPLHIQMPATTMTTEYHTESKRPFYKIPPSQASPSSPLQPAPFHIQMPATTNSTTTADHTDYKRSSYEMLRSREALRSPPQVITTQPMFPDGARLGSTLFPHRSRDPGRSLPIPHVYPPVSVPGAIFPVPSSDTSASTVPPGFRLPATQGTDAVSYLKFYQEQLVEQQERIREQQQAIQERQQNRLKQLKQFQEQLRSMRTGSELSARGPVQDTEIYWRSLVPTLSSDTGSSSSDGDTRSQRVIQPHDNRRLATTQDVNETTLPVSNGDGETSSSLSPFPSVIVPVRRLEDVAIFPKPSELGLWSDSTIQLSSSEVTKSSSDATAHEKSIAEQSKPRDESEISSSSLTTKSSLGRSSSSKSKSSLESGLLSSSSLNKTDKSITSCSSDNNNNPLVQLESSFQHFQDMIEEAKTLNKKYLSPSQVSEEVFDEIPGDTNFDELVANFHDSENDEPVRTSLTPISEEFGGELHDSENDLEESFDQLTVSRQTISDQSHGNILGPLQTTDEADFSSKDTSITNNSTSGDAITNDSTFAGERNDVYVDDSRNIRKALPVILEETLTSEENYAEDQPINFENNHVINYPEYKEESDLDILGRGYVEPREESLHAFRSLESRYTTDEDYQDEASTNETIADYPSYDSPRNHSSTFPDYMEHYHTSEGGTFGLNVLQDLDIKQHSTLSELTSTNSKGEIGANADMEQHAGRERISGEQSLLGEPNSSEDRLVPELGSARPVSQTDESNTEVSDMSLQDVFRRRKSKFIQHSEERVRATKEVRFQQPAAIMPSQSPSKEVTASSEKLSPIIVVKEASSDNSDSAKSSGTKTKIDKQDMAARTKRLYQNLPDVQKKRFEKERQESYAANRAKAQEFQKQTRERLRKLKDKKSAKTKL